MVRIAPVRLAYNPKTLWFDARDLDLMPGDSVVVLTARGLEFGALHDRVFEPTEQQLSSLKSPLKPVKRLATEEDVLRSAELDARAREALPVFKRLSSELGIDMSPVSVEFLFDGERAVFYFESEDRVDFRELVRRLAAEFHVRVDMKQIGVRDEARMVGGYGHCGQELCCRRLGGEFCPVSIRMAKEQDLSLNPQKISGVCGRLMCCLRYEFDAYKEFKQRAPKKNAKVETPDGVGKVIDLDVMHERVGVKLEGEKPVKVPLSGMCCCEGAARPNCVDPKAWEAAHQPAEVGEAQTLGDLFSAQLTEGDQLASTERSRRANRDRAERASSRSDEREATGRRSRRSRGGSQRGSGTGAAERPVEHRQRRRRSTRVEGDAIERVEGAAAPEAEGSRGRARAGADPAAGSSRTGRTRRSRSAGKGRGEAGSAASSGSRGSQAGSQPSRDRAERSRSAEGSAGPRPGRRSSELRQRRGATEGAAPVEGSRAARADRPHGSDGGSGAAEGSSSRRPRRRRTHRSDGSAGGQGGASGSSGPAGAGPAGGRDER
ncbi:hypothetical protein HLV38_03025 [Berryella wangjianweii]|uniref:PSP1 C-terminal domain-containing protein n=1 Tax=Berryella wangjianweii TaxID=2734634 RepID=A0A6M8IZS1_9ACTN|nr:regulatory iron-sulfur-containing complex subunit RicT [Berryella wangjianweii]QKF07210.1 hypothetical protein HLV38_03025 [Berryella wangjianweii]